MITDDDFLLFSTLANVESTSLKCNTSFPSYLPIAPTPSAFPAFRISIPQSLGWWYDSNPSRPTLDKTIVSVTLPKRSMQFRQSRYNRYPILLDSHPGPS